jgi:predicted PurR-regulated permease PerM
MLEKPRDSRKTRAMEGWHQRWPPMSYWAKWTVTVLVTAAVLAAARSVLNILVLVLVAAVFAIGLDPAVRILERLGMRRGIAVVAIFFVMLLFLLLFALLVVPPLVREATGLANDIPRIIAGLQKRQDWIGRFVRNTDLPTKLSDLTKELPQKASQSFQTILGVTKGVASVIFNVLTIAILMIYFLLSLPRMRAVSGLLFSPERREVGERVLSESLSKIGGFVTGNLLTSLIAGVAAAIAFVISGVPFAIALAMWVAIADLIPAVGATLGAIPAIAVGFSQSFVVGLVMVVYFIVYQQVENYFIVPRIMKDAVDLSPAAVIVSTLIGGSLAGFAGALLALPVGATIKVIVNDLWLRERMPALPEPEPAPEAEGGS